MKTCIKIGFLAAGIFVTGMVAAVDKHHPAQGSQNMMGDPAQMQQMMNERMDRMKSMLNLNSKQEKYFNDFVKQKNAMMKDMMKNRNKMSHKNMGNMQGKNQMQDHQGMMGQQGMKSGKMGKMQMMSGMSFEQRLEMMEQHGKKLLAASKAGKKFYNSLSSKQKKKLNDMPKNMNKMKMKMN